MPQKRITFTSKILRKQADLPRYIVVKAQHLRGRTDAFQAMVSLNQCKPFARNVRPWGKGSDAFFFNLTQVQCQKEGLDTGDSCEVVIEVGE